MQHWLPKLSFFVYVYVCAGLERTSDPMELELQAAVSCPLWVLGTVGGPLGEKQGSSPLSHLSRPSAVY